MGWYLKKSFAIGPLRLSLSKSGLGASLGVKGLRVGTGPKGAQVNVGGDGLYYRASLNSKTKRPAGAQPPAGGKTSSAQSRGSYPFQVDEGIVESTPRAPASPIGRQLGIQMLRAVLGGLLRGR